MVDADAGEPFVTEHDGTVVIAGAGPAGIATAIAAARSGCRVLLLEQQSFVGGTVTGSLIHTLGGFFDDAGLYLNQGLSVELCERLLAADERVTKRRIGKLWCLSVAPALFGQVVTDWLAEAGVTVWTNSRVLHGELQDLNICTLELYHAGETVAMQAKAVVDATGTADVVKLLAPEKVMHTSPRAAGGLIFRLRGCEPGAVDFPKGLQLVRAIRQAAEQGALPLLAGSAWLDNGTDEDELFVKLTVPLGADGKPLDMQQLQLEIAAARDSLVRFLQKFPALQQAVCVETGQIGIRDGACLKGRLCLSEEDLLQCRSFPDAACRGAWPLEYWDQEQGVRLRYLPAGGQYEIPLRCLRPDGIENLWAAGKCLSATPQAQASARVVGCCWAMGDAVGRAVATTVHKKEQL